MTPFFYSNGSNDILLRKSDEERLEAYLSKGKPTLTELELLWHELARNSPPAPHGGYFTLWANVRCPHCNYELPYNEGVKNIAIRINDSKIILIDGATIVGDSPLDSWNVKVEV